MIRIRKTRNKEWYSVKDITTPYVFIIYVSSREKAEEIKKNWYNLESDEEINEEEHRDGLECEKC